MLVWTYIRLMPLTKSIIPVSVVLLFLNLSAKLDHTRKHTIVCSPTWNPMTRKALQGTAKKKKLVFLTAAPS